MTNKSEMVKAVLRCLVEDSSQSIIAIAKKLKSYRQRIWRIKKRLENEKIIWGYTAVIDDMKLQRVIYIMLSKIKPLSRDFVNLVISRLTEDIPLQEGVRLIHVSYINGTFDWTIMFSAPDHATARRYYDSVRLAYAEYLLEKPVIIDVNFPCVREGKVNPDLQKLYEFVPS
jgi:DNA-binding Lrp family transcriptional regulator